MYSFNHRRYLRTAILAATLALLAACAPQPKFELNNVSGHLPDLQFNMTNGLDQPVTAASYRGKIVMMYFGYTHCPDVCPLTLAHMHQVLQTIGRGAADVQFIMVTVDPARDTPEVLHKYVTTFDPRFVGLTGTQNQIAALAKRYRVFYQRQAPKTPTGNYEVDHSSLIYIFDRQGHARLLAGPADPLTHIEHDLKLLVAEKA
ncbi:MAG: SCO family protein [Gammaproteobacteria bacterium]